MDEIELAGPKASLKGEAHDDLYPSRKGSTRQFIERKDPVVYAANSEIAPVAQSLLDHYEEHGFVVLDDVFTSEEINRFQGELERLMVDPEIRKAGETISELGSGDVRSIFRVHESNSLFKALSSDQRLTDLAKFILNDDIYIHQSRINYKPGFRGKEFYWHSDFETWHVEDGMPRMRALSMSITLTENFEHNGPLMLIPGSHKQYVVCEGETPDNHYLASLKKQEYGVPSDTCLKTLVKERGIVSAKSKPGSVIVFDCNVMHGSNGNITPFSRSNVFFVYNAISNKVVNPFCNQAPRPEHICTRQNIRPIHQISGNK
ncbi:MAG: ectoine hydroxylase [Cellvibrionaceae bacterium]